MELELETLETFSIREYVGRLRTEDGRRSWPFEGTIGALPAMEFKKQRWWGTEVLATGSGEDEEEGTKKRSIVELFAVAPMAEVDDRKGKRNMKKKRKKKKKREKEKEKEKEKEEINKAKLSSSIDFSHLVLGSVLKRCRTKITKRDPERKTTALNFPKHKRPKSNVSATTIPEKHNQDKVSKPTEISIQGILKNHKRFKSMDKTSTERISLSHCLASRGRQADKRVSFSGKDDILGQEKEKDSRTTSSVLYGLANDDSQQHVIGDTEVVHGEGNRVAATCIIDQTNATVSDSRQLNDDPSLLTSNASVSVHHQTSKTTEKNAVRHDVDLNRSLLNCNDYELESSEPCSSLSPSCHMFSGSVEISKQGSEYVSANSLRERILNKFNIDPEVPYKDGYISRSSHVSSLSSLINLNTPESSFSVNTKKGANTGLSFHPVDPSNGIVNHGLRYHPLCHVPREDFSSYVSSSTMPREPLAQMNVQSRSSLCRTDAEAIYRHKYVNGGFVGLPLNSQGELIQLHSSGNLGTVSLHQTQNMVLDSRTPTSMHSYLEPVRNSNHKKIPKRFVNAGMHVKDKSFLPEQCSLYEGQASDNLTTVAQGYSEFPAPKYSYQQHSLGEEYDWRAHQLFLEKTQLTCDGYLDHNTIHVSNGKQRFAEKGNSDPVSQITTKSTVRLMGKNVAVGKSGEECQGLEDGNVWMDKEIVSEQKNDVGRPDKPVPQSQTRQQVFVFPGDETPKYNMLTNGEVRRVHDASGFYQISGFDPRLQSANINSAPNSPNWIGRNSHPSMITRSHFSTVDPFIPFQKDALLNEMPTYPKSIPPTGSVTMFPQLPVRVSRTCDGGQQILFNSRHGNGHNICNMASSPAFYNPNYESRDHFEFPQFPVGNLRQWLLDAAKHKIPNTPPSYPHQFTDHHSQASEMNFFHFPPPCTPPVMPSYGDRDPRACISNLHMSSTLANPFNTTCSTVNSKSNIDACYHENWMNRDKTQFRFEYLDGHYGTCGMKKRPLSESDQVIKSGKKPNLVILDDSDISESDKIENSNAGTEQPSDTDAVGEGNKTTCENRNEKVVFSTASVSGPTKQDNGSRSGPIKLSAGAKHILKPSQNRDPRPIYSTIPFAPGSGSSKVPVPQKSATVFQF